MCEYMYVIDISDPVHNASKIGAVLNGVYTSWRHAADALREHGFRVKDGKELAFTDGKITAVISKCPVNPHLGVEEVQLR